jgi:hypothetical protein
VTANIDPANPTPQGPIAPAPTSSARAAGVDGVFEAALAEAQNPWRSAPAELPPTPPPGLAANIAAAAHAWDSLAASSQHVVFNHSADGQLSIELADDDGNSLGTLSGSELFGLIDEHGGG